MTSVLVTHDINEAVYLSDKVYIIKGRPAEISSEVKIDMEKRGFCETSTSSEFRTAADLLAAVIFEEQRDNQRAHEAHSA